MSVCKWCNGEMLAVATCAGNTTVDYPDGSVLEAVPYAWPYPEPPNRCHDCGIAVGGHHHPGCDMERCPRCDGQLISCGCLDDEELDASTTAQYTDEPRS